MGAGSWGTTFAQVLCDAGTSTVVYARRAELAKALREQNENPDYLPGITLTSALVNGQAQFTVRNLSLGDHALAQGPAKPVAARTSPKNSSVVI